MSEKNSNLIGSKIPSPCKNKCNYDQRNDKTCTGCYRTEAEVYEWRMCSDWRRVEILDNCEARKMDEYRFTWFDKSSLCEAHKIYTGNKQDCIKQFRSDNPDVPLSRVVISIMETTTWRE